MKLSDPIFTDADKAWRAFEKHEPTLDAQEAYVALDAGKAAISLRGLPCVEHDGTIACLAIKFAFEDGKATTVLLDRFAASALTALVRTMDSIDWNGKRLDPTGTAH